ncbi:MAG: DUF429 domain-containing protein [Rubrivivax sp.]
MDMQDGLPLLGVDFSSAPSRRKPITVARGLLRGGVLRLQAVELLHTLAEFEALLRRPGPWLGGFDFPFGLPRAFVQHHGLGATTSEVIGALRRRCATRMDFRALVDAWGNARPAGQRLLHRACDTALGGGISSTSPLQTRYVPVGFMYYEGLARLVDAGCHLPDLHAGDERRVALEAYPGLLAHELIGRRSYKNSECSDRLIARKDIVERLEQARSRLDLRLQAGQALREQLVQDASGDRLDAVLCLAQAAWASAQPGHGLPPRMDPLEGWIATAPAAAE